MTRGGRRAAARRRGPRAVTAPTRPVYLEIATDLLAAEVPGGAPPLAPVAAPAPDFAGRHRRDSTRAERPLLWVGGGARDAADGGPRAGRAARRAGADDLRRGRRAPPGHPCLVGLPPHVEAAGRLWDEADVVLAIGSDLDGVQTRTSPSHSRTR